MKFSFESMPHNKSLNSTTLATPALSDVRKARAG